MSEDHAQPLHRGSGGSMYTMIKKARPNADICGRDVVF